MLKFFFGVVLLCKSLLAKDLFPLYSDYGTITPGCSFKKYIGPDYYNGSYSRASIGIGIQPENPGSLDCATQPKSCPKTRYRSYDGSCNNLKNPILGMSQTPLSRLLPHNYGDGISTPTKAKCGKKLPLARKVSLAFYPDDNIDDPKFTLAAMMYGQVVAHEMSLTASNTPSVIQCCTRDGQIIKNLPLHDLCLPIILPPDDPQTLTKNVRCMNFVRSITDRYRGCAWGKAPAEQINLGNHFLDMSIVYGDSDEVNKRARKFNGGKLLIARRHGKDWLPQVLNASESCASVRSPNEPCYFAGDIRVNQNPHLAAFHTIFLREHNRLAAALAKLNPHWDDEKIFQEARRINIAENQHITYYEWLPIFLGVENSLKNKLIYEHNKEFVNDYDESLDPRVINAHTTAAFRYFHTLIAGCLDLISGQRHKNGNIRLTDWLNRPLILEQDNNFDDLTRGMTTQLEKKADVFFDSEVTEFMFRTPGATFGVDLKAIDIQRNRDHGLASYNDFRELCGLPRAHAFKDFLDVISPENVQKLSVLYGCPDDVEVSVGGSLEKLVDGTLAGPVNLCILTKQFYRTRAGDRFFYENGGETGFSLDQLNEIRKASISRLICDNANGIRSMQPRGFVKISHQNAVVSCKSLPAIDLTLWKEHQ